jgi:hypothetical protein
MKLIRQYMNEELLGPWEKEREGKRGHPKVPRPTPKLCAIRKIAARVGIKWNVKTVRRLLADMEIVTTGQKNYGRKLARG